MCQLEFCLSEMYTEKKGEFGRSHRLLFKKEIVQNLIPLMEWENESIEKMDTSVYFSLWALNI